MEQRSARWNKGEASVRTALFVPGDRPDRVAKAAGLGADAVVVDLEDAVADSAKGLARSRTVEALAAFPVSGPRLLVRLNAVGTAAFDDDFDALRPVLAGVDALVLPKVDGAAEAEELHARLEHSERTGGPPTGVVPIVETARGILAAREIAQAPRVSTLLFGAADLSDELGLDPGPDGDELLYARSQVVLASAAAGVGSPLDGPYLRLDDADGLARSARYARRLGFAGKAVIHPAQLPAVDAEFRPDAAAVRWAHEVDVAFTRAERAGQGSVRLGDGTFVDYPVARRARAILAEAATREAP